MVKQPSNVERVRHELGMARQAAEERKASAVTHDRADAHLADLEERYGHLLSKNVTDAAMGTYFSVDQKQPYRGRRPRTSGHIDGTAKQRRYARHLLSKEGVNTRGLERLSRAELGSLIGRLSS